MLINSPDCSSCLFSWYRLLIMVGGVGCVSADFSQAPDWSNSRSTVSLTGHCSVRSMLIGLLCSISSCVVISVKSYGVKVVILLQLHRVFVAVCTGRNWAGSPSDIARWANNWRIHTRLDAVCRWLWFQENWHPSFCGQSCLSPSQ